MRLHQVAVMSGKGGAGKTSLTAALLKLFPEVIAVDADVNASNLPILLPHQTLAEADFRGMDVAQITTEACTKCGKCREICAFGAIEPLDAGLFTVNNECEGCAACAWVCPTKAVAMEPHISGHKYVSQIMNGYLVHADLIPGEDNSGKLIANIREDARQLAEEKQIATLVIDGPPGTSCQAISSLTGVQLVLVVLEESLSGLSDYRRLAQLLKKFRLPHLVVVNKSSLNTALSKEVKTTIVEHGGRLVASIPFDAEIPKHLARKETLFEMKAYRSVIEEIYQQIQPE